MQSYSFIYIYIYINYKYLKFQQYSEQEIYIYMMEKELKELGAEWNIQRCNLQIPESLYEELKENSLFCKKCNCIPLIPKLCNPTSQILCKDCSVICKGEDKAREEYFCTYCTKEAHSLVNATEEQMFYYEQIMAKCYFQDKGCVQVKDFSSLHGHHLQCKFNPFSIKKMEETKGKSKSSDGKLLRKEGMVTKERPYLGFLKFTWQKRFCVLEDKKFMYYDDEKMGDIKGVVDFDSVLSYVTVNKDQFQISMLGSERIFKFNCQNHTEAYEWAVEIQKHIDKSLGKANIISLEGQPEFWKVPYIYRKIIYIEK